MHVMVHVLLQELDQPHVRLYQAVGCMQACSCQVAHYLHAKPIAPSLLGWKRVFQSLKHDPHHMQPVLLAHQGIGRLFGG